MRIGEVAELTGLNISNIRFYERKGLLLPVREKESKYRNYTQEDVSRIKKILLYRKMGIAVETIYLLLEGEADLTIVLERQRQELAAQMENLQGAMDLCCMVLKEERIDEEKLDEYLNYMHEEEEKGKKFAQMEELLEDIVEYTKIEMLFREPCIAWLVRKPWIAKTVSILIWAAILAVPLINVYAYAFQGGELKLYLIVCYGIIIAIYAAGFLAFRRAQKKEREERSMEE